MNRRFIKLITSLVLILCLLPVTGMAGSTKKYVYYTDEYGNNMRLVIENIYGGMKKLSGNFSVYTKTNTTDHAISANYHNTGKATMTTSLGPNIRKEWLEGPPINVDMKIGCGRYDLKVSIPAHKKLVVYMNAEKTIWTWHHISQRQIGDAHGYDYSNDPSSSARKTYKSTKTYTLPRRFSYKFVDP